VLLQARLKWKKMIHDPNIISIDVDHKRYLLRKLQSIRKLLENKPWGIETVLEDSNFWNGLSNPEGEVAVCVADTGYDLGHEDLPKAPDVDGTDVAHLGKWSVDRNSHGSHCAGTVAAIGGNDKGVPGVIPNNKGGKFKLLIGKVFGDSGNGGLISDEIAAIQGCIDKGAKVISLSLGGEGFVHSK